MMRTLLVLFFTVCTFTGELCAKMEWPEFVRRSGANLILGDQPFYAIGVNSYFLENIAALGDTDHVVELFREAQDLGVTTIRTWGFFDCEDSTNPAGLQWSPGKFNENGLRALDYVVATARKYSIHLIIPFVNNWDDYGGMNQYVRWYAGARGASLGKMSAVKQRTIVGAGGRSYLFIVADTLTHDHFYTVNTIRQWYQSYVAAILNRTNSLNGLLYKDDPTILAWELANESRSSDPTGEIVNQWMEEMSVFVKSIDKNHLLSTGEEGLDVSDAGYASSADYSNQTWLFDGTGGTSFQRNLALPSIDVGSIHCYPSAWGISPTQAIQWFHDHQAIADRFQKPLIFGEIGTRRSPSLLYAVILNEGYYSNTAGILLWQFVYDGRPNNDGYAFSYPSDQSICRTLQEYGERFERKRIGGVTFPRAVRLENYPNPFNSVTLISYTLPSPAVIRLDVYNSLGQCVSVLSEGMQSAGVHLSLFEGTSFSAGTYFLRLTQHDGQDVVCKASLIK